MSRKADPTRPLVLLVEDDGVWRMVIRDELEEAGYRVRVTSTPDEARSAIGEELPNLIILDILLTSKVTDDLSGLKLARELAREEKTQDIPRMFATVVGLERVRREALEVGEAVLVKPFDFAELRRVVAGLIPKRLSGATATSRDAV